MDKARAKEIIDSPELIYVTYQNLPVWLTNAKDDDQIEIMDMNSDLRMVVPGNELVEIARLKEE